MNFAIEAGFMDDQDKEDAQKVLSAIKKGVKPPNCRGKEECDSYCQSDEHFEECANFAEAAGFMSAKDAEMARKTKGKGPGGCKGKEECETFCNNKENQEVCFKFAEDNGMIPEEELKKMKEGMNQMRGQEGMPPQNFQEPGNEQRQMGPPAPQPRELREGEREWQNNQMPPPEGQMPREFQESGMPPPGEQFQPSGPMPQIQQLPQIQQQPPGEIAPPPPPLPSEPVAPQSLLNNKYLGAIFRFLFSD